jgi:DNA polymerase elongation subunit (family B)
MSFYTSVCGRGAKLLHRGWNKDGTRIHEATPFRPCLYVPTKRKTDSPWRTIDGKVVDEVDFESGYEAGKFIEQYKSVDGFTVYGDIDPCYQFIAKTYEGEMDYDPSLVRIMYLDIEVESENGFASPDTPTERVNGITVRMSNGGTTVFGLGEFDIKGVTCKCYDDETKLLADFVDHWKECDTDIITGWNVRFFDLPYLHNRIASVLGEKEANKMSPWGRVRPREVYVGGRKKPFFEFDGITTLDYYDLYDKFTFTKRESYKLEYIASVELGEGKVSYEDYGTITDFYRKNFQKFMEYNVRDVDIVVELESKLRLIELALGLAYSAKCNFGDVFTQVRMWDVIVYNELRRRHVVIPPRKSETKDEQFVGAYVKDPQVGQHEWVASFDLDSLYPHLILQYNISPETLVSNRLPSVTVDELIDRGKSATLEGFLSQKKADDLCVAANGTTYRRDIRGFLPELMDKMYAERKEFKKKMLAAKSMLKNLGEDVLPDKKAELKKEISKYGNFQLVRKVQLNSAYGALGNEYFRYYNLNMAEAITTSGQLSIRWIEKYLNEYLNKACGTEGADYVIASDTDSVYLRLSDLVNKVIPNKDRKKTTDFLDKFCHEALIPFINKRYDDLSKRMNAYANRMSMKREAIALKGIWTAKKRYMLSVALGEDNVYMESPELKIMGIETTRSSTPSIVRERLKEAISIVMTGDEGRLQSFVSKFLEEFKTLPVEKVAFPRSCNGLEEYADRSSIYKKATPIAVKGSLLYNHWIAKKKLLRKYQPVRDSEKIKFVYLRSPNPIQDKVISFPNTLPPEFGLEGFIDYDLQFEKSFAEPLSAITDIIGWKLVDTASLEDLFV